MLSAGRANDPFCCIALGCVLAEEHTDNRTTKVKCCSTWRDHNDNGNDNIDSDDDRYYIFILWMSISFEHKLLIWLLTTTKICLPVNLATSLRRLWYTAMLDIEMKVRLSEIRGMLQKLMPWKQIVLTTTIEGPCRQQILRRSTRECCNISLWNKNDFFGAGACTHLTNVHSKTYHALEIHSQDFICKLDRAVRATSFMALTVACAAHGIKYFFFLNNSFSIDSQVGSTPHFRNWTDRSSI